MRRILLSVLVLGLVGCGGGDDAGAPMCATVPTCGFIEGGPPDPCVKSGKPLYSCGKKCMDIGDPKLVCATDNLILVASCDVCRPE